MPSVSQVPSFCEGPYCVPVYENGKQTGTRDCGDCPLCDELRREETDEFWAEEEARLVRQIAAASGEVA